MNYSKGRKIGRLRVSLIVLEKLLSFPVGCRIVGVEQADERSTDMVGEMALFVEGPDMPEVRKDGAAIQGVDLVIHSQRGEFTR